MHHGACIFHCRPRIGITITPIRTRSCETGDPSEGGQRGVSKSAVMRGGALIQSDPWKEIEGHGSPEPLDIYYLDSLLVMVRCKSGNFVADVV